MIETLEKLYNVEASNDELQPIPPGLDEMVSEYIRGLRAALSRSNSYMERDMIYDQISSASRVYESIKTIRASKIIGLAVEMMPITIGALLEPELKLYNMIYQAVYEYHEDARRTLEWAGMGAGCANTT